MPSFKIPRNALGQHSGAKGAISVIKKPAIEAFNPSALGLGEIKSEAIAKTAIAAIFDLQGFTTFCKQVEPNLTVPIYLNEFLEWLFSSIRKESINEEYPEGVTLWHNLPFFTKFMGDGILVLWDTSEMVETTQHNLISSCLYIVSNYEREFLPKIRRKVSDTPPLLRCGIAKGTVFSVGNGEDFVGSCINIAARLQKMAGVKLAFSRRGFNPEEVWKEHSNLTDFVLKKVAIRGIGDSELIYITKKTFAALSTQDKKRFQDP